ncbi:hypothetical protein [Haloarchaeobius sp. HME9146]|uniref:hypothetical protein n=1 Tax=Haloarchaeobius sp. HME9146 TaxID=2978732 RepID=UPI0021C1E413|nr:hypothetical protein [Haloarchaeobius sp. HME9146]MCT9097017.1 hypothetical protein [Haloarchaeobius sp. HME9146]
MVIKDHVKQRQVRVVTDRDVVPEVSSTSSFKYPVDEAFTIRAKRLSLRQSPWVYLRSSDGEYDQTIRTHESIELEAGYYSLDFTTPVKIYARFSDGASISKGMETFQIEFSEPTDIEFGVRSYHKRPAGSITTTGEPADLMSAISTLSSSLKTMSCERSYPTLRGYPPRIELGDELRIPDQFERPKTGIEFIVPPQLDYLFSAAPLTYYLGAELVPGRSPRLVTDHFEYQFDTNGRFETEVSELLKQFLFLDCVVRTEGLYQVDLHERHEVESSLPFDIKNIYDWPLREQLPSYLEVSFDEIEPYIPRWCLTAYLPPRPKDVRAIPHIVNELGIIREPRAHERAFERSVSEPGSPRRAVKPQKRSVEDEEELLNLVEPIISDDSIEHAWFGDGVPVGASKSSVESFEHQLDEIERNDSIDITVVCNDPNMIDEQETLDRVYGDREEHPFSVTTFFGVSKQKLAEILQEGQSDLLHYIGHATPDGLRCSDGELDIRELDAVSLNVFLLNACRSFEQAEALVKKGAYGGVATLGDIVNEHAVEVGQAIAHLLNLGFPLRATVELVHKHGSIGQRYIIVGDGSLDIVQPDAGAPMISSIEKIENDDYELSIQLFPTKFQQIGTTVTPHLDDIKKHFLHPGTIGGLTINKSQLIDYLTWNNYPFDMGGEINWNETLGVVLFED